MLMSRPVPWFSTALKILALSSLRFVRLLKFAFFCFRLLGGAI